MADEEAKRTTQRKEREGIVVSTKMDKTVVVAVIDRVRHRRYGKTMQRTSHLYAHDERQRRPRGRPCAPGRDAPDVAAEALAHRGSARERAR